ncbi:ABC transporter ATP-binding protein [Saccharothrix obliqua]|uniref:ABC transporter ATP-binding protein n=1 Tax=Saccharothrix obliqua TaxID=2861747 RepID=UPI001C5F0AF3|nr:ABC transporter ATP-binding protein [Saccharothrix obliqua]MBW4719236.1 ABC transporter ATP-binding protein [Saccharothrix obliqua]
MTTSTSTPAERADDVTAPALAARTRGLRKVYGRTVAVDRVDLDVPRGAVLGMLGPNGSGKTTTIRMLLGLVRPTEGEVELLGRALPDGAAAALPHVGALVEGPGFHPFLTGRENLRRVAAFEPLLATGDIKRAVEDALERVGLAAAAHRRYRGYSLGMKQRLGLAAALLVPRELIVLDEPTNGLDPAGTREVRNVIAELRTGSTTVVVSSHLLSEIEATCTHVAVLHRGTVVAQGGLTELLQAESSALLVTTPEWVRALNVLRDARISARAAGGESLRVELIGTTPPAVLEALVKGGIPVWEARRQRTGLEELFARLTEAEEAEEGLSAVDTVEEGAR